MNDDYHYTSHVGPFGNLILVRHAESQWNELGRWTGRSEVHLTDKGWHDARLLGEALVDTRIDYAFSSEQVRTIETLNAIIATVRRPDLVVQKRSDLDERDYGEFTGLNKWEVKQEVGDDEFLKIRRSWNYPIPGGETLEMVFDRVVPFYLQTVVPLLTAGQNVLIVSHGNTLRALVKFLRSMTDDDVKHLEIRFDTILEFHIDSEGKAISIDHKTINITATEA